MNFKNQISTSREQSERLLSLGVKPGTADMYLEKSTLPEAGDYYIHTLNKGIDSDHWFSVRMNRDIIPAWSLSRLLEMMPEYLEQTKRPNADLVISRDNGYWSIVYEELGYDVKNEALQHDLFDAILDMIDWLIQNGHFNKEYCK